MTSIRDPGIGRCYQASSPLRRITVAQAHGFDALVESHVLATHLDLEGSGDAPARGLELRRPARGLDVGANQSIGGARAAAALVVETAAFERRMAQDGKEGPGLVEPQAACSRATA
jgi:hypothetical protein